MEKLDMKWFKKHYKDKETYTLKEYTLSHIDLVIHISEQMLKEFKKLRKEIINSKPQASPKARSHNNDFKAHKSSPKPCPECKGRGWFPDSEDKLKLTCPRCKGQGFIKS